MAKVVHVLPLNDIQKHSEGFSFHVGIPVSNCACQPKSLLKADEGVDGGWVIVHSAFDGREALEEFNEVIRNYKGIKVSSNWDFEKSFQWLCENAKFIFSHKSYKGEKLKMVINEPIGKFDCFEIGYDRYGVMVEADTVFSNGWGDMIEDSSKDIVQYIKDYLIREGASDLIYSPR